MVFQSAADRARLSLGPECEGRTAEFRVPVLILEFLIGIRELGLERIKKSCRPSLVAEVAADVVEEKLELELAKELNLPIIIHDREAHEDTLEMIRQKGPFPAGGVMHCFSGDTALASQLLDAGLYISIPGIVTFKNAAEMQQVVRETPLDRMLLETDGPFLAPVPYRGKRNLPEYLLYTAAAVAELKGIPLEEVARQTTANTRALFSLPDNGINGTNGIRQ